MEIQEVFKWRQREFKCFLNNLFDIANVYALPIIKLEEDKFFLVRQREPGRLGYLEGVDKNLTKKNLRLQ